jgi:16S rRNA (uracil1498-N3)-methyltransferase
MSAPRFYVDGPLAAPTTVTLPAGVAHHVLRALRLREGDELVLFDGRGGEYAGKLAVSGKQAFAVLERFDPREAESPLPVTLVQALAGGDKMDWVVEKAVELGVAAIQPVQSERSVVRLQGERADKRRAHWQAIAVAASEQCGRNRVVPVQPILRLDEWLAQPLAAGAAHLVLHPDESAPLWERLPAPQPVVLLIGPEGGWSEREVQAARAAGYLPARCGPRVLRTETAGLAVLAALQARHGDF